MTKNKILKLSLCAVAIVGVASLSGCSTGKKNAGADGAGDGLTGVQTTGLGDEGNGFGGNGLTQLHGSNTTPGASQTYYFDFDSNQVHNFDYASIKAQAGYLKQHPNARVHLGGNTDARGSRDYNLGLGERRGDSVSDILKLDGVPARQIIVVSYGQERPAEQGTSEQAYAKNRRVNLLFCKNSTGNCGVA